MAKKSEVAKTKIRDNHGRFVKFAAEAVVPDANFRHVATFMGIPNLPSHLYRNLDEALKHSQSNAKAMRRDPVIMEALFARQMAVAELQYSLEPEDPSDKFQKTVCDELTKIVDAIPNRVEMFRNLEEAVWFGKHAVIIDWAFKWKRGLRKMVVEGWQPIMGDKLVFDYDTNDIGYRVNPSKTSGYREIRIGTEGMVEMFDAMDRECLIVHKHFITDGEFDEPEVAVGIEGVGIRSQIYWAWYSRSELLGYLFQALERYGASGGFLIGYFEAGNPASMDAVRTSLEQQQQNNIILFPRPIGEEGQGAGLEFVPMNLGGIESFMGIIDDYYNNQMRRMIIGLSNMDATSKESGTATEYEQESCARLIRYDAANLGNTLTTQFIPVLQKHNFPSADFDIRFKFHVDKVDPTNFLESAQRMFEMNGSLDEAQVRSVLGLSKPKKGADVLKKTEAPAQDGFGQDGFVEGQTMRKPIVGVREMSDNL